MTGSLLTASEVAELLGVPVSWVYEQSRAGRIPTVTLGRYRPRLSTMLTDETIKVSGSLPAVLTHGAQGRSCPRPPPGGGRQPP